MSNLRRQRGYFWEDKVVEKFSALGYETVRLGGTTTSMPDVSVHNDSKKTIISIECKSTVGNICTVPGEQIQRCIDWCDIWGLFDVRLVILAFKFGNNKSGHQREKREYFKIWKNGTDIPKNLKCNYDGTCYTNDGKIIFDLEDFKNES